MKKYSFFNNVGRITSRSWYVSYNISLIYSILLNVMLIVSFHIAATIVVNENFINAIKSVAWYSFALLLPGASFHQILLPKQKGFISFSVLCYVFGFCYNILLYFIIVLLGLQSVAPIITIVFTGLFIYLLANNKDNGSFEFNKADFSIILLFIIYLVVNFIVYVGDTMMSASDVGTAHYHPDSLWWLENAVALTKGFPPADLRIHGAILYYHYFASIQLAIANLVTGVDIFTLASVFYPLMKCFIFVGGLYILIQKCIKIRYIQFLGLILMMFCTGFENFSIVTFSWHTLMNPFGCDIGLGLGSTVLYMFYLQYENTEKIDYKLWVSTILTAFICTGVKAPLAAIMIAAIGIPCLVWFFSGKYKLSLLYGIGLLTAFLSVSIFCAGLLDQELARTGSFSLINFAGYTNMQESLTRTPYIFKWLLALIMHIFSIHPLIVLLCTLGGLYIFFDQNFRNIWNFGMFFACMLGFLLGAFNIQKGNSQMYFSMAALIPGMVLGMRWLEQQWVISNHSARICSSIICCFFVFVQMTLFFHDCYIKSASEHLQNGLSNFNAVDYEQADGIVDAIQRTDMEALEWIRDNTPPDSVLLADRGVITNSSYYMYYGTFSERQMLVEGDVYAFHSKNTNTLESYKQIIFDVFSNKAEALEQAKEAGATHIIQTKWITPGFVPDTALTKLVYETKTIAVYELCK